jgi:hypothetical protein
MSEVSDLLAKASNAARAETDAMFVSSEAVFLRKVARLLCLMAGHDPDIVVMGSERQPLAVGAKGVAALQLPIHPQWLLYVTDARNAIEVLENAKA